MTVNKVTEIEEKYMKVKVIFHAVTI